jgi:predicted pyridoxine 5'-phosphate oxidase superfamily flavin-nucleotide-binding protein
VIDNFMIAPVMSVIASEAWQSPVARRLLAIGTLRGRQGARPSWQWQAVNRGLLRRFTPRNDIRMILLSL